MKHGYGFIYRCTEFINGKVPNMPDVLPEGNNFTVSMIGHRGHAMWMYEPDIDRKLHIGNASRWEYLTGSTIGSWPTKTKTSKRFWQPAFLD